MLVAQVSDSHLIADEHGDLYGVRVSQTLRHVLNHLAAAQPRPDLLILSGDMSDDGSDATYERLQSWLLDLAIPYVWIAGNHDQWEPMRRILTPSQKVFERDGWRFVLVDSKIHSPDIHFGRVADEELDWLDRTLAIPGGPTVVVIHHHPIPVHSRWIDDTYPLCNAAEFRAVLQRHELPRAVLFGHAHQEVDRIEEGIRYLGAPATSQQFIPFQETLLTDPIPPGYRLIELAPDGSLATRVVRCGD